MLPVIEVLKKVPEAANPSIQSIKLKTLISQTRKRIAKKGKKKYMKFFNSTIVADYIINNTFEYNYKKNTYLLENIKN